jgi:hypothetical protein
MATASGPSLAPDISIARVFTTSGTFTPSFTGTVEVLVVGGGGAGGGGIGGGGGGGGVVYMPAVSVTSGTAYTIVVGAGGAPVLYSGISGSGGDSTAFGATAKGGGGSGVHDSGAGVAGGCGGGAASNNGVLNQGGASSGNSLGSNTGTIYGNRGGNMTATRTGGPTAAAGGGGAGAAAADTNSNTVQTTPGNANGRGGAGIASNILGTLYYWAGGGGGGGYFNGYAGDGGIGGGGGGSCSGGIGPTSGGGSALNSGTGAAIDTNGAAGGQNTGGGGGGGAWQVTFGGAGGSGIVIIRYNITSLDTSTGGAPISLGNMALCLDATNPNSNIGNRSIINWNNWTTGSGGVSGYGQNGNTGENERVTASNPWGNTAVVWEARPSGDNEADGGWNTTDFAIDNTQLYRFSVWVRRTSSTSGGTFYLGTGSNGGVRKMSDDTAADNPYWECRNTGILAQNTWYLFVGHIYPANTTFTGRNPNTGYYTINGRVGDINGCNIGTGDLKWNSNSTTSIHRTYLYYCPDNTTRLQFYQPRVDLCDGTEPSIQELLNDAGNTWYDVSGNNNNCKFFSLPTTNTGFYSFNGTDNYGTIINNATLNFASAQSLQIVMRHTYTSGRRNPWDQAYGGYGTWTHEQGDSITQFYGNAGSNNNPYVGISSPATPRSVWNVMCAVRSRTEFKWYINGVLSGTTSNPYGTLANTAANITIGNGYAGFWQGDMAMVTAYTRALSDSEVAQNFNAIRGRFGL